VGRGKVNGCRVEDLATAQFRPLDSKDMRTLRQVIIGDGERRIDRWLLGRLLLERERLCFVAACAGQWAELLDYASRLEKRPPRGSDPETTRRLVAEARGRAEYLLRHALRQMEGAGARSVSSRIHRLVIEFAAGHTRPV